MRLPLSLSLVAAGLALGAAPAAPAVAGGCQPTTDVLSRTPAVAALPGGARTETYDTGGSGERAVHAVVVRIPAGAALRARVAATPSLTTAAAPTSIAGPDRQAVVVANGDFFDPQRGALPAGAQMVDGVLRKAVAGDNQVLAVRDDGAAEFADVHLVGSVTAGDRTWALGSLNNRAVTGGVSMYTDAWGPQRRPAGTVDVLVRSGKVVAVRRGRDRGAPLRAGETVLTASGSTGGELAQLAPGTAVSWDYRPSVIVDKQEVTDVHSFIGVGGHHVKKGRAEPLCTAHGELLRPRTAIGWTAGGDTLLVTFSGRALRHGVRWGGATQHQVGAYMKQLGCVDALGLDGGTSTTLAVRRSPGAAFARIDRPAKDAQRKVPDAVVFDLTG